MMWIAIALGHFVLVDVLTLYTRSAGGATFSTPGILDTMGHTASDFGGLGKTTAYRATAGFSVWVALSLAFLGATYLLLARQRTIATRPFAWLGALVSLAFAIVAYTCFIVPPFAAAIVATILFTASALREA